MELGKCNDTELYQLCRKAGIPVLPSTKRMELIAYLTGAQDPEPSEHPIDAWRHGLTGFVFDHWSVLEPQLTCPIRTKDPNSCWGCTDTQVITCVVQNPDNEEAIRLHKKVD